MRAFTPEPTRSSSRSLGKEKALRAQLLKTLGPPLSPKSQAAADATASANKKKAEAQSRNKDAEAEQKEKDQAIEDSRPSGSNVNASRRDLKRQDQPKPGGRLQNVEYTTIEEEMAQRQRDKHQQLQELEGAAIMALAALRKAGGKLDVIKRSEAKRIVERSKARKSRSPRRKSKDRRRRR